MAVSVSRGGTPSVRCHALVDLESQRAAIAWLYRGGGEPYKTWMPDGIHRYWGNDPRLHTEVGERTGKTIRTTGSAGFLVYGPYAPFSADTYRITIKGIAQSATAGCWLDVACDSGKQRVLYVEMDQVDIDGEWAITNEYVLDHSIKDLEVRLWVPDSAKLSISSITISPAPRAQPLLPTAHEPTNFIPHEVRVAVASSTTSSMRSPSTSHNYGKKSNKNKRR